MGRASPIVNLILSSMLCIAEISCLGLKIAVSHLLSARHVCYLVCNEPISHSQMRCWFIMKMGLIFLSADYASHNDYTPLQFVHFSDVPIFEYKLSSQIMIRSSFQ